MKLAYIIVLTFLSFNLFAQDMVSADAISIEKKLVKEAIKTSKESGSPKPIEELLNSKKIIGNTHQSILRIHRAYLLENNAFDKKKSEIPENQAKEILKYYDSIVDLSDSSNKWKCEFERQQFIERCYHGKGKVNDNFREIYSSNLGRLKDMGYSPSKIGFSIGPQYFVGKEGWLGLQFSMFSGYQPAYTINSIDKTGKSYRYKKYYHSIDALKFGYSHSFSSHTNDSSLSLAEVNAPIVFIPAKFGIQYGPNTAGSQFYYRPGIGFSVWRLSLSYSYNLMFFEIRSLLLREKFILYELQFSPIVRYYGNELGITA